MNCPTCGHEWSLHLNTNACCEVVRKAEMTSDHEYFKAGPLYCLCDKLPPRISQEKEASA